MKYKIINGEIFGVEQKNNPHREITGHPTPAAAWEAYCDELMDRADNLYAQVAALQAQAREIEAQAVTLHQQAHEARNEARKAAA